MPAAKVSKRLDDGSMRSARGTSFALPVTDEGANANNAASTAPVAMPLVLGSALTILAPSKERVARALRQDATVAHDTLAITSGSHPSALASSWSDRLATA
ncbi:MAG: hypothetical protein Kilf2KO_49220 [Rhodospirillales bacterium]